MTDSMLESTLQQVLGYLREAMDGDKCDYDVRQFSPTSAKILFETGVVVRITVRNEQLGDKESMS